MPITDEPSEVLDLVNKHDQVVGIITREETAIQGCNLDGWVRAADCFMLNSKGAIFVPRRAAHKKTAPGGYDFSVGEHVMSGETYEQAMVRGFKEELRMEISGRKLKRLGMLDLKALELMPYFNAIFVYQSDMVPDYNREDFVSYEWLAPAEFLHRLKSGEPAKNNILPALELFLQANK